MTMAVFNFESTILAYTKDYDLIGALDLTLTSRLSAQSIEQITVELFLGEGATGGNCTVSSGASWGFDPKTLVCKLAHSVGF